jgi:hypothetical protein
MNERERKEQVGPAEALFLHAELPPLRVDEGGAVVSSAPAARAQNIEFVELISLGPAIVPLLMDKLTGPEEFFALVAVDRLASPELVVRYEPDDEAALLGEQGRAIETVQRWVQMEA